MHFVHPGDSQRFNAALLHRITVEFFISCRWKVFMLPKSTHVGLLPKATSFDTWHSMFNIYVKGNNFGHSPGNILDLLVYNSGLPCNYFQTKYWTSHKKREHLGLEPALQARLNCLESRCNFASFLCNLPLPIALKHYRLISKFYCGWVIEELQGYSESFLKFSWERNNRISPNVEPFNPPWA